MSLLQHHLCVPVKFLWSTALKRTGLPGIKKKKKGWEDHSKNQYNFVTQALTKTMSVLTKY